MQTTDITPSLAPDLVKDDWNVLEVWVDSIGFWRMNTSHLKDDSLAPKFKVFKAS